MASAIVKKLTEADEIDPVPGGEDLLHYVQSDAHFEMLLRGAAHDLAKQAVELDKQLSGSGGTDLLTFIRDSFSKKVSDYDVAHAVLRMVIEQRQSPNSDLAYKRIKKHFRFQL